MNVIPIIVTYHFDAGFAGRVRQLAAELPEIIIVDNASNAECQNVLNVLESKMIHVIRNAENLGIAAALNQGVLLALALNCEWVLTLDQDSTVTTGMVQTMLRAHAELPKAERAQCLSLFPVYQDRNLGDNCPIVASMPGDLSGEYIDTEITSGNLVHRDAFDRIGYYTEKLFIDFVDHDFCFRLRQQGILLRRVHGAKMLHELGHFTVHHFWGRRFYSSNHAPIRCYYITRNRFYVYRRYGKDFPEFVRHDRKVFWINCVKILLGESNAFKKLYYTWLGYRDFRRQVFGPFEQRNEMAR